jgi:hypothetical protein
MAVLLRYICHNNADSLHIRRLEVFQQPELIAR